MATHDPVLLNEVVSLLNPSDGGRYMDCTFGGGGHTRAMLDASDKTEVLALDQDPEGAVRADAFAEPYQSRFSFKQINFAELEQLDESNFDGILFDLGISSFQLDQADRGFSFRFDAPLDLRMNPDSGYPASEFLETCTREDLVRAIRDYGEEKHWRRIVNVILEARGSGRLARTHDFAELLKEVVGNRARGARIHPATQSFQGIRIFINRELESIEQALPIAMSKLAEGGVLAVISFHSLEDRVVKRFFKRMAGRPEHANDSTPQQFRERHGTLLTRRPIVPNDEEINKNPRSRSAKLRAIRKEKVNAS